MKKKIRTFKLDLISIITIIVITIALGMAIGIYIERTSLTECEADPFVYGSQVLEREYNAEFHGNGYFSVVGSPTLFFDSKNMTLEYNLI